MNEIKPWDSVSIFKKLELLVGDHYGPNPLDVMDNIKQDKYERGELFVQFLGINSDSNVLEIGSGMGFQSKALATHSKHLTCLDISKNFLLEAQYYCQDKKNITFVQIEKNSYLPFLNDQFDVILSDAVFIHLNIYDIYFYLKHCYRVLKPSGKFYFNAFTELNESNLHRFEIMASLYHPNPDCLCELVQWNDATQILYLAEQIGYTVEFLAPQGDTARQFILRK